MPLTLRPVIDGREKGGNEGCRLCERVGGEEELRSDRGVSHQSEAVVVVGVERWIRCSVHFDLLQVTGTMVSFIGNVRGLTER